MLNKPHTRPGLLIVISGPSGSGKTSVVQALCQSDPALKRSISATTRPPRPAEADGVNYHFLSASDFKAQIQRDGFLEWAKYGEHYYGTLKSEVEPHIAAGRTLILEIDVHGAMQIRALDLKSTLIFVIPPSFATLETRLRGRNTETDPELQRRLRTARSEIAFIKNYDYCVINPENAINRAVEQIHHIIAAERCRIDPQLLASVTQEFSPLEAD
jgi:guanylate kinase